MIPYTILQAEDMIYEDKGVGLCVYNAAHAREWGVRMRDWVASEMSFSDSKLHCNLPHPNVASRGKPLLTNALCMSGCTRGLGNVHLIPVKVIDETLWGQAFDPVFHDSVHVHACVESPPSLPSSIHPSPSAMLYYQSSPLASIPHLPVMSYFPSFN